MAECPISIYDLKNHLRVTDDTEDGTVRAMGTAATSLAENYTQRLFSARTCVLLLTDLPSGVEPIELPGGTVASVTSVVADGTPITGCTAVGHSPALLIPAADWPAVTGDGYPVVITYVAGIAALPFDLRAAVKLIAADMFEQRSSSSEAGTKEVQTSARMLMDLHRIRAI